MGRAAGIITKLDAVLNRVGPNSRKVYKRVITRTGGDALIGRPGSVTYADTLMSPQPLYGRVSEKFRNKAFLSGSNKVVELDDLSLLLSPTAITLAELKNPDLVFVLKDSAGAEEIFRLIDYEETFLEGTDVLYSAVVRSVKR